MVLGVKEIIRASGVGNSYQRDCISNNKRFYKYSIMLQKHRTTIYETARIAFDSQEYSSQFNKFLDSLAVHSELFHYLYSPRGLVSLISLQYLKAFFIYENVNENFHNDES